MGIPFVSPRPTLHPTMRPIQRVFRTSYMSRLARVVWITSGRPRFLSSRWSGMRYKRTLISGARGVMDLKSDWSSRRRRMGSCARGSGSVSRALKRRGLSC